MVSCKNCGRKGLSWRETLSGYQLCDSIGIHICEKKHDVVGKRRKSKNL